MDVWQSLINLGEHLLSIAESGPVGALLAVLILLGLIGVIDRLVSLVRALRARSHTGAEPDEDVTNPNTELATALSKLSDALLIFANGFTPVLKAIQETTQNTEASVAGLAGEAKKRQPVDTAVMESQDVMAQALDRLQKSIANIRTKEDAALQNTELREGVKVDTALAVAPVLSQVTAAGIAIGAVDTGIKALHGKVDALPPHLDALIVKLMAEMPPLVRQEYAALLTENKALTEQKTQAESARDVFRVQVEKLTADLAARDEQIRVLQATRMGSELGESTVSPSVAALPRPEPIGETKPEAGAKKRETP